MALVNIESKFRTKTRVNFPGEEIALDPRPRSPLGLSLERSSRRQKRLGVRRTFLAERRRLDLTAGVKEQPVLESER